MKNELIFLAAVVGLLTPAATQTPDTEAFSYRCPLAAQGMRRISYDLKLFTHCFKPKTKDNKSQYEGDWIWGVLDLGRCLANDDGIVRERNRGNFQTTCGKCEFEGESTTMSCSCPNKKDEWIDSKINLDNHLRVKDGLVCCKNVDVCGEVFDADEYHVPPPARRSDGRVYNETDSGHHNEADVDTILT